MPNLTRIACTRCKESVYNCIIDGPNGPERVPLAVRLNVGQPDDTGGALDVIAANIRVPSIVRSLLLTPIARIELCVKCFGEVFGLPLVTAEEDPMYSDAVFDWHQAINAQFYPNDAIPLVERFHHIHARALHSLAVGWGEAAAEDLPAAHKPAPPAPKPNKKRLPKVEG